MALHASRLAAQILQYQIRSSSNAGKDVLFMAGGTGSGKSTAVAGVRMHCIVYDSTLSNVNGARRQIQDALDHGHEVIVQHVWRDPIDAFKAVIERGLREGAGRTVRIDKHILTHRGAVETVLRLTEELANEPRVEVCSVVNVRGQAPRKGVIEHLRSASCEDLEPKLLEILENARESKQIDDLFYRATLPPKQGGQADGGIDGFDRTLRGTSGVAPEGTPLP